MMERDGVEITSEAARLAVCALCLASDTAHGWPRNRVLLLPELDLVDCETATQVLEKRSKPLVCLGVEYFGSLAMGSWQVEHSTQQGNKPRSMGNPVLHSNERIAVYGPQPARDPPLLVISAASYEYWTTNYRIIGVNYSLVDIQEGTQERFALHLSKWDREGFALGILARP